MHVWAFRYFWAECGCGCPVELLVPRGTIGLIPLKYGTRILTCFGTVLHRISDWSSPWSGLGEVITRFPSLAQFGDTIWTEIDISSGKVPYFDINSVVTKIRDIKIWLLSLRYQFDWTDLTRTIEFLVPCGYSFPVPAHNLIPQLSSHRASNLIALVIVNCSISFSYSTYYFGSVSWTELISLARIATKSVDNEPRQGIYFKCFQLTACNPVT